MRFDTDFYKFTMSYFAWTYYRYVNVKLGLISRKQTDIFKTVKPADLAIKLAAVALRPFSVDEQEALLSYGFPREYVEALAAAQLPAYKIHPYDSEFAVTVEGPWWITMFWETYIMSAVSELHGQGRDLTEARKRLNEKIAVLKIADIKVVDFGTRRRHSASWHGEVLIKLRDAGLLAGTSNVAAAYNMGITPVGTMAHEVFMVPAALMASSKIALRATPQIVLEQWRALYGKEHSTALTDTYTTESFLADLDWFQTYEWDGFRHDSGDPLWWAERVEKHYQHHDLSLRYKKKLVFSDGLTVPTMMTIKHHYGRKFECIFGWGTDLTNDTGEPPLDTVVKVVEANGNRTVKLSDDSRKTLGPGPKAEPAFHGLIQYYRDVFK